MRAFVVENTAGQRRHQNHPGRLAAFVAGVRAARLGSRPSYVSSSPRGRGCARQPAARENDAPGCRRSHSLDVVHTSGTPFFCFTQRDLDRSRYRPHRCHASPDDANRGTLNAARGCPKVVHAFRVWVRNGEVIGHCEVILSMPREFL